MYQINVKDWRKIPMQNLQFILSQAESKLIYTINNSDKITQRFYSILILLIGLFTAGIGYFSNLYSKCVIYNFKYFVNIIFLIILFIEILLFIKHINPRLFNSQGRYPNEFSNNNFLEPNNEITEEEQYKALIIGEINNLESKLEFNKIQNKKRLIALRNLIFSILVLMTIYFILFQLALVL
ncbi:hypothetical protein [Tenacibaculum finnmarkense]|uniref:hypothetical protein n=1 Tax=Tenacibaculum finnmarkense TaxID=2781243 RepID=UPI001E3DCDBF|nr:hypothetical protein [Tenacibaculum finnmarkense]MCD8445692.1 hypothetical protein [Tenacibaculum finnmarkense genomovar ulcerans]